MNQKLLFIIIAITGSVLFSSCGQSKGSRSSSFDGSPATSQAAHVGELSYKKHCMSCHQKDAGGIPGMYPPLAENKTVSGDREVLINIVLNGMSGELVVNGKSYNGVMASYRNLSDKDIANILNYIRSGFGNSGREIKPGDVKALR